MIMAAAAIAAFAVSLTAMIHMIAKEVEVDRERETINNAARENRTKRINAETALRYEMRMFGCTEEGLREIRHSMGRC